MKRATMAIALILLTFLLSCVNIDDEQHRKEKVKSLVEQLADGVPEKREFAYAELRDVHVRKRDIPYLKQEISQNRNAEVTGYLSSLTAYIEQRWRLPDKGWTDDRHDLLSPYFEKSKSFESTIFVRDNMRPRPTPVILMEVYFPDKVEHTQKITDLVLTLEPETLSLLEGWNNISFLSSLMNLQELCLEGPKLDNLMPLKGLPNLLILQLKNTKVTDLTPLKEIPTLRLLYLEGDQSVDLTPLSGTSVRVIKLN